MMDVYGQEFENFDLITNVNLKTFKKKKKVSIKTLLASDVFNSKNTS